MVKRAGKRKHRKGRNIPVSGKNSHKPGETMQEDNLRAWDSIRMEVQAVDRGWVLGGDSESQQKLREAMLARVARICISSTDEGVAVRALQAVARAEQNHQRLRLAAIPKDMPEPVQVNVNVDNDKKPYEVIQELMRRRDVQAAVTGGVVGHLEEPENKA